MSFEIIREVKPGKSHILKERTYLNKSGKLAAAGDNPKFLLGAEGASIPEAQAKELGLLKEEKPEVKESAPAEDKASEPSKNKGRGRKK